MADTPPPFAEYPRIAAAPSGSAAHLQSLADGYFGLSRVFGINIVLSILGNAIVKGIDFRIFGIYTLVIAIAISGLTYGPNRKIGIGAGWAPFQAIIASLFIGLNSAFCCGVLGYTVMHTISARHMKKYGLKPGFFGFRKADIAPVLRELQAKEAAQGRR